MTERGFLGVGTGNAGDVKDATEVRYPAGNESKATLVASVVTGPVTKIEDGSVRGADIVLVLGRSFRGIAAAVPATPAPTGPGTAPQAAALAPVPGGCDHSWSGVVVQDPLALRSGARFGNVDVGRDLAQALDRVLEARRRPVLVGQVRVRVGVLHRFEVVVDEIRGGRLEVGELTAPTRHHHRVPVCRGVERADVPPLTVRHRREAVATGVEAARRASVQSPISMRTSGGRG